MPVAVFAPPKSPTTPISLSTAIRKLEAGFGDGYTIRALDGLNTRMNSISLNWQHLTSAEATAITDFFEARNGVEPFDYTLPFFSVLRWTCSSWNKSVVDYDVVNVTAELNRVYDLGT